MVEPQSRAVAREGKSLRAWSGTIVVAAMILALIALPVGFVMQLPLVLGLSIVGIVAGGIALTS